MNPPDAVLRFPLLNVADHPIVLMDGLRVCLDTGSPFTFRHPQGPSRAWLLGQERLLAPLPGSAEAQAAADRMLGTPFDVLLGMDLMGPYCWRLDWSADTAEAAPTLPSEPDTHWLDLPPSVPFLAQSCPVFRLVAAQETVLLDTGAHLSYRVSDLPATARRVGEARDFNPSLGTFSTPVWEDEVDLSGHPVPVRFGRLPAMGAQMLATFGVDWVLGSDLLRRFRLTLDLPAQRLGLRPHGEAA